MRFPGGNRGVHAKARETLLPAAMLWKVVSMGSARIVGYPEEDGSQSARYERMECGAPAMLGGWRGSWEDGGKTVEMVPRGVRARMRRPRMADSREVGIRWGGGGGRAVVKGRRGRRGRRRGARGCMAVVGRCCGGRLSIVVAGWRVGREVWFGKREGRPGARGCCWSLGERGLESWRKRAGGDVPTPPEDRSLATTEAVCGVGLAGSFPNDDS